MVCHLSHIYWLPLSECGSSVFASQCGGAHSRARPTALRRRRGTRQAGPSNHTGAQTVKRRKAGARVTAKGVFKGEGRALNEDIDDEDKKKAGTGFGKKAGRCDSPTYTLRSRTNVDVGLAQQTSQRRTRLGCRTTTTGFTESWYAGLGPLYTTADSVALAGSSTARLSPTPGDDSGSEGSDDEGLRETDQDRRRTMLEAMGQADLEGLKNDRTDYSDDFVFPPPSRPGGQSLPGGRWRSQERTPEVVSDSSDVNLEDVGPSCDVQTLTQASSTATTSATHISGSHSRGARSGKERAASNGRESQVNLEREDWSEPGQSSTGQKNKVVSYGNIVKSEVDLRRKEALGMAPTSGARRLGRSSAASSRGTGEPPSRDIGAQLSGSHQDDRGRVDEWSCLVCTLYVLPTFLLRPPFIVAAFQI